MTQGENTEPPHTGDGGEPTEQPGAPTPIAGQLSKGTVFAGYTIDHVLGHGGMGTVYVAAHPRLPRMDVLKLLNPSFSTDSSFRARFEREADLAGSLEHRNIVSVYDRGAENGQLWIAMRYVRGYDASALIRTYGGVDPEFAAYIITEIGTALDHAHRRGMVHRDVKPANILIESEDDGSAGAIMLTDFGIARAVDDAMHLTDTGLTVASVPYASPEQLHGYELDGRADIYALACTFVELLTGTPPYPRDNRLAAMSAHLHDEPPSVHERAPELPIELDAVIAAALAKDPEHRYRTCTEFAYAATSALGLPGPYTQSGTGQAWPGPAASETSAKEPSAPTGATSAIGPWRVGTSVVSDPRVSDPRGAGVAASASHRADSGRIFSPTGNPDSATQVVIGGGRTDTPPPSAAAGGPSRRNQRTTTILVSLATILALIGVIAGVLAFLDRGEDVGTWSSAQKPIADTFSQLLPAGPKGTGWGDATCQAATTGGLDAITCAVGTGVRYTVWHTPDAGARTVVTSTLGSQPGSPRTWTDGPVSVSNDAVTDGWVLTNFTDSRRQPYTITATWSGHSGQQLLDDWWKNAPFDS